MLPHVPLQIQEKQGLPSLPKYVKTSSNDIDTVTPKPRDRPKKVSVKDLFEEPVRASHRPFQFVANDESDDVTNRNTALLALRMAITLRAIADLSNNNLSKTICKHFVKCLKMAVPKEDGEEL